MHSNPSKDLARILSFVFPDQVYYCTLGSHMPPDANPAAVDGAVLPS